MPRITHQIRDIVTSNGVPIGKGEIAFPGIRNGIALRIKDAVNEFASLNEALSYKPRVNVALAHARANSWKHSSVGVIQYIGRTFKQGNLSGRFNSAHLIHCRRAVDHAHSGKA